jgi:hypothetical protein
VNVDLLPEVPDLRAPVALIDALLRDPGAEEPPLGPAEREALAAAGGLPDGRLHPRLAAVRAAVAGSLVDLLLERGARRGRGWMAPGEVVLVHPLPDERVRLVAVSPPLAVDALVRLNDVGPRPRYEPAVKVAVEPGALAEVLATGEASRAGVEPGEPARALASIAEGLREHWKVTVRWEPAEGALPGRELEVIDTDAGYWLVIPDPPTVELWPTTPTAVFRSLAQLFPLTHEIAPART